jgi:hypothetical protein
MDVQTPEPTATSFFDGTPTTMSNQSFDTPEMVVRGIFRAFDQGKAVAYPGRASVRIATWLPGFCLGLSLSVSRQWQRARWGDITKSGPIVRCGRCRRKRHRAG